MYLLGPQIYILTPEKHFWKNYYLCLRIRSNVIAADMFIRYFTISGCLVMLVPNFLNMF
jgi:hypothetical protein